MSSPIGVERRGRKRLVSTAMLNWMKSLTPYVIVFTASGCTLVIEIVAGADSGAYYRGVAVHVDEHHRNRAGGD